MAEIGWLTVAKTAEAAGVTAAAVYDWIKAEKIASTQVGGRVYVLKKSLVNYLGPIGAKAAGLVGEEAC